jgi:Transcriptional regulator
MEMSIENKISARERILDVTVEIIATEGIQNVTIRKIASLADVNVAAINYYFGSKDSMINEAIKCMTGKLIDSYNHLNNKELNAEIRLRIFVRSYADTLYEYPDIFRNYINQSMNNGGICPQYIEFIKNEGFHKLKNVLKEATNIEDEDMLHMKLFQMVSSLEFPILLGNQLKDFSHFDYNDRNKRYDYLELILNTLLSK